MTYLGTAPGQRHVVTRGGGGAWGRRGSRARGERKGGHGGDGAPFIGDAIGGGGWPTGARHMAARGGGGAWGRRGGLAVRCGPQRPGRGARMRDARPASK
jgi:hypothetical protein